MDAWWREHRPEARDLFARELVEVLARIASAPAVAVEYTTRNERRARRALMPKTKNHVYFVVDSARDLVTILAVWGAPRGKGPAI